MRNKEKITNQEMSPLERIKLTGKKVLAVAGLSAALGATVTGCSDKPTRIENKQTYEAVMNNFLAFKPDLSIDFSEDGTTISYTEHGDTRFTLKDEDNDTLIESGSVVYGGKVAEFSENDGVPIDGAERLLRHKLNAGQ